MPVRSCARQGIKSLTLFNYQKQRNDLDKVGLPPSFFLRVPYFWCSAETFDKTVDSIEAPEGWTGPIGVIESGAP